MRLCQTYIFYQSVSLSISYSVTIFTTQGMDCLGYKCFKQASKGELTVGKRSFQYTDVTTAVISPHLLWALLIKTWKQGAED